MHRGGVALSLLVSWAARKRSPSCGPRLALLHASRSRRRTALVGRSSSAHPITVRSIPDPTRAYSRSISISSPSSRKTVSRSRQARRPFRGGGRRSSGDRVCASREVRRAPRRCGRACRRRHLSLPLAPHTLRDGHRPSSSDAALPDRRHVVGLRRRQRHALRGASVSGRLRGAPHRALG